MLVAKPTLIVTLNSAKGNALTPGDLRQRIETRLITTQIEPANLQDLGLLEWCEGATADFNSAFRRMRLESGGIHAQHAGAALAKLNLRLEFRVIIICDRLGAEPAGALGGFLDDINRRLLAAAGPDISIEVGVLLLDNYDPPAIKGFTVRARATPNALGGIIVEFAQVREACQHLLVLLLTAPAAWNHFAEMAGRNKWCTFGAAAAIMDQQDMTAYVRASTFAGATQYLVQHPDSTTNARLQEIALHLADRSDWQSAAEKILVAHECTRTQNSPDPNPPFQLEVSAPNQLAHIESLDAKASTAVSKVRREHWRAIATAAHHLLALRRPTANALIDGPAGLPNGLQQMRTMLHHLQSNMSAPTLILTSDSPSAESRFRFTGPALRSALAAATDTATNSSRQRQKRIERVVLHPLGQLLWLAPFWLGFTLLLGSLELQLNNTKLADGTFQALFAAAITIALGTAEWWYWRTNLKHSALQIQNDIILTAGRQSLYIVNSTLWRAHDSTVAALAEVIKSIDRLHKLFSDVSVAQNAEINRLTQRLPDTLRTRHLRDLAKCGTCADYAINALELARDSAISQTLADTLFPITERPDENSPLLAAPWQYERAFRDTRGQIKAAADEGLANDCPDFVLVVTADPQMKNGAIWDWLIQSSWPLGTPTGGTKSRYFFSDPVPALWETADGGTNRLENLIGHQHYKRITSPLNCEIVCVCAYIDTPYDAVEQLDPANPNAIDTPLPRPR